LLLSQCKHYRQKIILPTRGRLGRGVQGGNAEPPERSPAALLVRAEPSKILFSLIEKIFGGCAQIQKCKEYFARRRASANGGRAASLVLFKKGSDFVK